MRIIRFFTSLVLALALCLPSLDAQALTISGKVEDNQQVKIAFHFSEEPREGELVLYRSTRPISPDDLNAIRYPITTFQIPDSERASGFIDFHTAHNTMYYYLSSMDRGVAGAELSNVISVKRENVSLPHSLQEPEILIDKVHYVLEVREWGVVVKSFPVILG